MPTVSRLSRARLCAALVVAVAGALAAAPAALGVPAVPGSYAWPTYHRDLARSGSDPDSAKTIPFAVGWSSPNLDGAIFGQPVVLGTTVVAVTENDTVYGLDLGSGQVRWQHTVGTPVPASALSCGDIGPTVGITSTPVIDPATGGVYAVADTWDGSRAHHVIVGYDVATGAPLLGAGINVDPPGARPEDLLQRASLNVTTGSAGDEVVFGYGGNAGDCGTYRGWVGAQPVNGAPARFYATTTTSGGAGAVWAPGGPAVDADGSVFAATGNGFGNPSSNQGSENVVHLDAQLNRLDAFYPSDWASLDGGDTDIGSATPELLGGGLVYQNGKGSSGYLLNTAHLGGSAGQLYSGATCPSFGGDALAGGVLYLSCLGGVRALTVNRSAPSFSVRSLGPSAASGSPIVAAGLVWSVASASGTLYGLDPATGAVKVNQPLGAVESFTSPSAAGGQLLVATTNTIRDFHIAQPPPLPPAPPAPPTPSRTGTGRLRIGRSARVRHGLVRLAMSCSGPSACSGTVALRIRLRVRRGGRLRSVVVTAARARFRLGPHRRGVLVLRLTALARRVLTLSFAHGRRQSGTLVVTRPGQRPAPQTLLLRG